MIYRGTETLFKDTVVILYCTNSSYLSTTTGGHSYHVVLKYEGFVVRWYWSPTGGGNKNALINWALVISRMNKNLHIEEMKDYRL